MRSTIAALLLVFLGGAALAIQSPLNGAVGRRLSDSVAAATISFGVGFAVLLAASLLRGEGLALARLSALPWWAWTGGLFGAFYMVAVVTGVSRLGVVSLTAALILGQLVTALLIDRFGAFGVTAVELSWQRVAAVMLVAAGLLLSRF